ncbi:YppG family protein [Bacillus dakarensis]|uniref:YppG family protein n=1 Tax=Robertmurraya dakarensis TaxID=1926278 RepID=UPI000982234E|nr:YppG family protein [Bacillus dakarensis]
MFGRKNQKAYGQSRNTLSFRYPHANMTASGGQLYGRQNYQANFIPQIPLNANMNGASMGFGGNLPHNPFPDYGLTNPFMSGGGFNSFNSQGYNNKSIDYIYQNPLQPQKSESVNPYYSTQPSYMHPYPKQSFVHRPPSGMQSILNSFKAQDGTFDTNKMIDTAGQMINAVSQVSSLVKGIGGIFKV